MSLKNLANQLAFVKKRQNSLTEQIRSINQKLIRLEDFEVQIGISESEFQDQISAMIRQTNNLQTSETENGTVKTYRTGHEPVLKRYKQKDGRMAYMTLKQNVKKIRNEYMNECNLLTREVSDCERLKSVICAQIAEEENKLL